VQNDAIVSSNVAELRAESIGRYWAYFCDVEEAMDLRDLARDKAAPQRVELVNLLRVVTAAFTVTWVLLTLSLVSEATERWLMLWATPLVVLGAVLAVEKLALAFDRH
jgi:hypothetical protein